VEWNDDANIGLTTFPLCRGAPRGRRSLFAHWTGAVQRWDTGVSSQKICGGVDFWGAGKGVVGFVLSEKPQESWDEHEFRRHKQFDVIDTMQLVI